MILFLILLAATQTPSQEFLDYNATRSDLVFSRAQEDLVESCEIPKPYKALIAHQGCFSYVCRNQATEDLQGLLRADYALLRWLWHGRRSKDPEIRLRCNGIIRRHHPCPKCHGKGVAEPTDYWPCWICDGSGTCWPYSFVE